MMKPCAGSGALSVEYRGLDTRTDSSSQVPQATDIAHDLPIEHGRMARPIVPRYLRRCTLCSRHAPGDERHFTLECPQSDDIRAQYPNLLQDARDSMRNLMWHQNQKALSDFVIAIRAGQAF